jgi:exosortase family protein XrtF
MAAHILKNPFLRFLFFSVSLYMSWNVFYEFYLRTHTNFDKVVIDTLVRWAEVTLQALSYPTTDYSAADVKFREHIGIAGSKGVTIGAPCDGVVLYVLFILFVVAFPGPFKHKVWFVPLGVLSVFYLNVLRIVGLVVIMKINESWLAFNHDYTFTIVVYLYVFLLWMLWVKKFSPFSSKSKIQLQ